MASSTIQAAVLSPYIRHHPASSIISRKLFFVVIHLAYLSPVRGERDENDLSSNLISDLAPILALFGEQVAKQFMAGALGWSDVILFAMVSYSSLLLKAHADVRIHIGAARNYHRHNWRDTNWRSRVAKGHCWES